MPFFCRVPTDVVPCQTRGLFNGCWAKLPGEAILHWRTMSELQALMRRFEGYLYDCTREIRCVVQFTKHPPRSPVADTCRRVAKKGGLGFMV